MKNNIVILFIILINNLLSFGQNNCVPTFSNNFVFIDNFAFHTIVNTYSSVDSDEYVSYSDSLFTTIVNIGETYPITISTDFPSGIYGKFASWIDYNNDSLFDNTELIHYDSISHYTTSGFVTIPNNNSFIGQRRLRVIYAWYPTTINPCGNYNAGEAEDYLINIVSNQPDTQTYCMPFNPAGMNNFIIDSFHLDTLINDNSGSNSTGYIFYPSSLFSANLFLNYSYSVYISKGNFAGNTGGYAVWIDLNDDGDFSNSERLFYAGPNLTSVTGTITIPNDTSFIGIHRLRVRSEWTNVPTNPCGLYAAGETEDYMINILGTTTSISNIQLDKEEMNVFPNPSNGQINIICKNKIEEVKITDLFGHVIYNSYPRQNKISFNIDNSGVYFLTISSLGKSRTSKLIVDK